MKIIKKALSICGSLLFIASLVLAFSAAPVHAANTTYYVDAVGGKDSNNGTTTATPWKTLSKVNSVTFQPGNAILFKAGVTINGQLWPKGSGSSGNVITIGSYGTGNKPIIAGSGADFAVKLSSQQYWDIGNLEITNMGASADIYRGAILINNPNNGVLNSISVHNNVIHDVNGAYPSNYARAYAGVSIFGYGASSYYNGLHIDNNVMYNLSYAGIYMNAWNDATKDLSSWDSAWGRSLNVTANGNTVYNAGGDGIVISNSNSPVIQSNIVHDASTSTLQAFAGLWVHHVDNGLIQYNEVYRIQNPGDGEGYDIDNNCIGVIFQYNYSHDNAGGFLLDMGTGSNNIVRYNVSQNDGNRTFRGKMDPGNKFYNNTIYIGAGTTINKILDSWDSTPVGEFRNNIIYNAANAPWGNMHYAQETNNIWYGGTSGFTVGSGGNVVTDPKFVNPGASGNGIATNDGYKLQASSPAIDAGSAYAGNGGKDFWMYSLYNGNADIGASEYQGTLPNANAIEGESGTYSGTGQTANYAFASDGSTAGFLGGTSVNYVTLNARVATAGTYTMAIHSVSGNSRTFFISVNGGTAQQVVVNGTSWTAYAPVVTVSVALNAGNNSIKFYNNSASTPDLDRIILTKLPSLNTTSWYKIVNRNSGLVLDVAGASTADGAQIIQSVFSPVNNIGWKLIDQGGGYYKIQNRNSSKEIGIGGGAQNNGANAIQWSNVAANDQLWSIEEVPSGAGYYRLINKSSGKALAVSGGSMTAGASLIQWDWSGGTDQQFNFVAVP